eukprot:gene20574-26680_t
MAGTFWYHLHSSISRGDGGYGFLIAEDVNPIASYNEEILVILSDWYHQSGDYIHAGLEMFGPTVVANTSTNTPQSGFQWPGNGQAILVNGLGNRNVYIDVTANQTYRVRLLNAASLAYYNFAIASHNLTAITEGSQLLQPTILQSIDIDSGQRFDFLINTFNKPALNYQITIESNWRGKDTSKAGIFSTVYLRYNNAIKTSTSQPKSQSKACATKYLFFDMRQQYVSSNSFIGLDITGSNKRGSYYNIVNDIVYPKPSLPINIDYNDVVQIVIQNHVALNGRCEQHPWHLHGNYFWVLGTGSGEYNADNDESQLNTYDPVYVDTVVNYPTNYGASRNNVTTAYPSNAGKPCGWSVIRFVADNPGMWLFHCHIDWHLVLGMAIVFNVSTNRLWNEIELPLDYSTCGISSSVYTSTSASDCPTVESTNISDNISINQSSLAVAFNIDINTILFDDAYKKKDQINELELKQSSAINPIVNPMLENVPINDDPIA